MSLLKKGNQEIAVDDIQARSLIAQGWKEIDPKTGDSLPQESPKSYAQLKAELDSITTSHMALMKQHDELLKDRDHFRSEADRLYTEHETLYHVHKKLLDEHDQLKKERDEFYAIVNGLKQAPYDHPQASKDETPSNPTTTAKDGKQASKKGDKEGQ
jgi:predicted nuclease with TOPRIM domain